MIRRSFRKGETLFHEGDPGDSFHLIEKGTGRHPPVDARLGDVVTLAILGPGESFGERALWRPTPDARPASSPSRPSRRGCSPRRDLDDLRASQPSIDRFLDRRARRPGAPAVATCPRGALRPRGPTRRPPPRRARRRCTTTVPRRSYRTAPGRPGDDRREPPGRRRTASSSNSYEAASSDYGGGSVEILDLPACASELAERACDARTSAGVLPPRAAPALMCLPKRPGDGGARSDRRRRGGEAVSPPHPVGEHEHVVRCRIEEYGWRSVLVKSGPAIDSCRRRGSRACSARTAAARVDAGDCVSVVTAYWRRHSAVVSPREPTCQSPLLSSS